MWFQMEEIRVKMQFRHRGSAFLAFIITAAVLTWKNLHPVYDLCFRVGWPCGRARFVGGAYSLGWPWVFYCKPRIIGLGESAVEVEPGIPFQPAALALNIVVALGIIVLVTALWELLVRTWRMP